MHRKAAQTFGLRSLSFKIIRSQFRRKWENLVRCQIELNDLVLGTVHGIDAMQCSAVLPLLHRFFNRDSVKRRAERKNLPGIAPDRGESFDCTIRD